MADGEIRKPRPAWLDGDDRRAKVKRAKANEHRIAKVFGGRRLPQSGAKRWAATDSTTDQGDVTSPDFLIEHKHTVKNSIALQKEWLHQVAAGARRKMKDPAVVLTFESENKKEREDYVVVSLELFERLRRLAKR